MRYASITAFAVGVLLAGCGQPDAEPEPDATPKKSYSNAAPAANEEHVPIADYGAAQSEGKVTFTASGENREMGWENKLTLRSNDAYPPEFEFVQTRPDGVLPQMITPFSVSMTVDAASPLEHVFVFDKNGKHRVMVVQKPIAEPGEG